MKQIVVMGDLSKWKPEAEFIVEMLHLTASRVVTINIGPRAIDADLNVKDLLRLFPGKTRDQCVGAAMTKLYSQGVADGILVLLGNEPDLSAAVDSAFAALPFGMPKFALVSGDCPWQGSNDIIRVHFPGSQHNLNPVIKICISNAVFAISGMALCNIHNFGSSAPTVGACNCQEAAISLAEMGINYIAVASGNNYLRSLICHGYIHGLLLGRECEDVKGWIEVAATRGIPVVIACKNPVPTQSALAGISVPVGAPVILVSPDSHVPPRFGSAAAARSPQDWLDRQSVPFKYGTRAFYWHAAKTLLDLLA